MILIMDVILIMAINRKAEALPSPGRYARVNAQVGQAVAAGQTKGSGR